MHKQVELIRPCSGSLVVICLLAKLAAQKSYAMLIQAWSAINSRAAPLLQAVPLLRVPIDFMRRQFENPR